MSKVQQAPQPVDAAERLTTLIARQDKGIPQEIAALKARIATLTADLPALQERLAVLVDQRQQARVQELDVRSHTQAIEEQQEKIAANEDLAKGLAKEIEKLAAEDLALVTDILPRLKKEVALPLMLAAGHTLDADLANAAKSRIHLEEIAMQYGVPVTAVLVSSDRRGFDTIPSIVFSGEPTRDNHFDLMTFYHARARKQAQDALAAAAAPGEVTTSPGSLA